MRDEPSPGHPDGRVLVVEDDAGIARLTKMVLQDEGFEVVTATDGAEALLAVEVVEPDVVVLDLQLPVMDGRSFFRALRASGRCTPVLIVSAAGSQRARVELGAEDALDKPFDIDLLAERVRALARAS